MESFFRGVIPDTITQYILSKPSMCAVAVVLLTTVYYGMEILLRKIPSPVHPSSSYILVTGCDTGFGNRLSKRLDGLGFNVFAACLTPVGESELERQTSDRVIPFIMDVSLPDSVQHGYFFVMKKLPPYTGLWGVVNNAGILGNVGPLAWMKRRYYNDCLNVNLVGLIDVTQTFLPLVKMTRGRIVNMASASGRLAIPFCGPYVVSKFGVEGFSDALRREASMFNIKVITIEPGTFPTNLSSAVAIEKAYRQSWDNLSSDMKAEYGEQYIDDVMANVTKYTNGSAISSENQDDNLSIVVDAYVHALTKRYPKKRYCVGFDCKYLAIPLSYLPDFITDFLIGKFLMLSKPVVLQNSLNIK